MTKLQILQILQKVVYIADCHGCLEYSDNEALKLQLKELGIKLDY